MEENEYNTRLMQLQNDQRLMAEEDKRSRAYQEQYEYVLLFIVCIMVYCLLRNAFCTL